MKKGIAIVDDNYYLIKSVREKLSFFQDIMVTFSAQDGQECLSKVHDDRSTDLILMDIDMPRLNGIETTAHVKQKHPQIKIVMLTVFDDDDNIFKAIQAGADGYLLKDASSQELYNAILQTLQGGAAMTPSIAMRTLHLLRNPVVFSELQSAPSVQLSRRETEVLEQMSTGLPYTAIAENLYISPSTVRKHVENIYEKLHVHSKIEALNLAKRNGLI